MTEARKGQKRGRETFDQIVAAAIRLLHKKGAQSLTHRAVAKEAGVSLALTTYYFTSINDIMQTAYVTLHKNEIERFHRIYQIPSVETLRPDEIIDYISTLVIRETTEFREQFIGASELMLKACRSDSLKDAASYVYKEKIAFWKNVANAMDSDDSEADAQLLFCSTLGKLITMTARGKTQSELSRTRTKIAYGFRSLFPGLEFSPPPE